MPSNRSISLAGCGWSGDGVAASNIAGAGTASPEFFTVIWVAFGLRSSKGFDDAAYHFHFVGDCH